MSPHVPRRPYSTSRGGQALRHTKRLLRALSLSLSLSLSTWQSVRSHSSLYIPAGWCLLETPPRRPFEYGVLPMPCFEQHLRSSAPGSRRSFDRQPLTLKAAPTAGALSNSSSVCAVPLSAGLPTGPFIANYTYRR